jgi:hypothetical protein
MQGDREGGYRSFALALGATKTACICCAAFLIAFLGLALWILMFPQSFRVQSGLAIEALLLLAFVAEFARLLRSQLRPDGSGAKPFYVFLWRLYALQYVALIIIFAPTQLIAS